MQYKSYQIRKTINEAFNGIGSLNTEPESKTEKTAII
jgi:hypothetical protein